MKEDIACIEMLDDWYANEKIAQDIARFCIHVDKSLINYAYRISTYQTGENFGEITT